MNTHQLPRAISILEQLLDRPEPEPADYNGQLMAAIAPHQIRLLQEACSYAHDWDAARDEDRGPSPYAIYVKEIQLAEAIVKTHQFEVGA